MVSDQTLVFQILQGDRQAFRQLIKKHERLVSFMVGKLIKNREEHEEICQDVFLKVYEKLSGFNFESKLSTWIATIAYRQAINAVRKNKLEFIDLDEELNPGFYKDETTPETLVADQDADNFVLRQLEMLPVQYKIVLTLFHVEGMTYDEIGTITAMPEGTVKSYLFRARTLLKDKVKQHLHKEELL